MIAILWYQTDDARQALTERHSIGKMLMSLLSLLKPYACNQAAHDQENGGGNRGGRKEAALGIYHKAGEAGPDDLSRPETCRRRGQ
ncbi:MAG: hypothetical protein AAF530_18645 [Pseudomonadota bacterium]